MERFEKLDTRALSLSLAASAGVAYLFMAILAAVAPSVAVRFSSVFSGVATDVTTAAANVPELTAGAFFTGLIIALLVGLAVGGLVGGMYNAFMGSVYESSEATRRAQAHR